MKDFMKLASAAARQAGKILKEGLGKQRRIRYKGEINLVTEIDRKAEKVITKIIRARYPEHAIMVEEGEGKEGRSGYKWIIDPLDGTTNYAHGYPCFCSSIALEKDGEVILGVIYDPLRNEFFSAEKGKGAYLNGKRISVSSTRKLIRSFLATGFNYDVKTDQRNFKHFRNFVLSSQAVRRDGSAALDLCYLGLGRFDGFWELKLYPWDVAAGALIVKEARGRVTDFRGGKFSIYSDEILASNGRIHQEMMRVLQRSDG
ncbi:MAG: inositol monophosphatase [Deltaproteobacteria bacterium]|nr:MAG: inositol monophosphatase [Deltaproteobacteria bacterium]